MRTHRSHRIAPFVCRLFSVLAVEIWGFSASVASAKLLYQAPLGGAALPLPNGYVACASAEPGGWTIKRGDRQIVPPGSAATDEVGRPLTTTIARTLSECASRSESLQLVALRALPKIDPKSISIYLDEGRIELGGRNLEGLQIQWSIGGHQGEGTCLVTVDANAQRETCAIALKKGLPAQISTANLHVIPAGSADDDSAVNFDGAGRVVPKQGLDLIPTRFVISRLIDTQRVVDLSQGSAVVTTPHPEAIASIDCSPAQCDLVEQGIVIRTASGVSGDLNVRPRLIPRVYFANVGDTTTIPVLPLKVAFCPMTVISGPAIRDVDDGRIVLRLDAECGKRARAMSFFVNDARAEIDQVDTPLDTTYVVLRTGRLSGARARIQARRAVTD